jgi:hypothetical protein
LDEQDVQRHTAEVLLKVVLSTDNSNLKQKHMVLFWPDNCECRIYVNYSIGNEEGEIIFIFFQGFFVLLSRNKLLNANSAMISHIDFTS